MKTYHESKITNFQEASFKSFRLFQELFVPRLHYHAEVEIIYFHKGNGTKFIDSEIDEFKAGELYVIGSNVRHTFQSEVLANGQFSDAFCIQFLPEITYNFVEFVALKKWLASSKRIIKYQNIPEELVNNFIEINQTKGIRSIMLLLQILVQITEMKDFVYLKDENFKPASNASNSHFRYDKCVAFIYDNFHEKITLDQISTHCSMSKQAFCRWFKQNFAQNLITYLNKVRINAVCQALITTDKPVQIIAQECGFESLSTFSRLFQSELGSTPSQYRKTLQSFN